MVAANSEDQKNERGEWMAGNKMDTTNLATVSYVEILDALNEIVSFLNIFWTKVIPYFFF